MLDKPALLLSPNSNEEEKEEDGISWMVLNMPLLAGGVGVVEARFARWISCRSDFANGRIKGDGDGRLCHW